MPIYKLACLIVLLLAGVRAHAAEFDLLLEEAGLNYSKPGGFSERESVAGWCHRELISMKQNISLCLIVRPLSRMQIDYDDPHSSAPDPNQVYPLLFESMSNQLADGRDSHHADYSADQAAEIFGAHWAAAAVLGLKPGGFSEHPHGLLLAMHRDGKADAYLIFAYADHAAAKQAIKEALPVLRWP